MTRFAAAASYEFVLVLVIVVAIAIGFNIDAVTGAIMNLTDFG